MFCPSERFVPGRYVPGPFVSGRYVWAPSAIYILSQISYKFFPGTRNISTNKKAAKGLSNFLLDSQDYPRCFSNIPLNEHARIICKNISDSHRVLDWLTILRCVMRRAQRLSYYQISKNQFRVELKDVFQRFPMNSINQRGFHFKT
jgi:hypothetical protein